MGNSKIYYPTFLEMGHNVRQPYSAKLKPSSLDTLRQLGYGLNVVRVCKFLVGLIVKQI